MMNKISEFLIKACLEPSEGIWISLVRHFADIELGNVFMTHTDNSDFCKIYFSGLWKFHAQLIL